MTLSLNIYFTLAAATALLILGRHVAEKIAFLKRYSIPHAVIGGLLAATFLTVTHTFGLHVVFDKSLLGPMNLLFFTTVGLAADVRSLRRGGRPLIIFFLLATGALVLQNTIGVTLARAFGLHPINGLLAGSITLSGGHGTGAAWAAKFSEAHQLRGITELAMACATYGLVAGGILAGPLANWLLRRHQLQGPGPEQGRIVKPTSEQAGPIPLPTMIETLMLIFTAMAIGVSLYDAFGGGQITLPSFIWTLLAGAVLRNVLALGGFYRVDERTTDMMGAITLSLFLSMVVMMLELWELVDLAIPILLILIVQTIAMVSYAAFITFRVMGRNYDAAVLAAGQMGLALGTTATAMINLRSIAARHGYSQMALLLIPITGAFLIDLANAATIQFFLAMHWLR